MQLRLLELDRFGLISGSLLIGRLQLIDALVDHLQPWLKAHLEPGSLHGDLGELAAQFGQGGLVNALGLKGALHALQCRLPRIDTRLLLRKSLRWHFGHRIRPGLFLGFGWRAGFRFCCVLGKSY
nr:hypothetical protein [Sinorhizobium medicae]